MQDSHCTDVHVSVLRHFSAFPVQQPATVHKFCIMVDGV